MHGQYSDTEGQVLGLAGLLQAAAMVEQLANTGEAPIESTSPLLLSLFEFDPRTPAEVYGGVHGVDVGLNILKRLLAGSQAELRAVIRYSLSMLYLEKKLSGQQEMLQVLRTRLDHCAFNAEHFSRDINRLSSSVAAVYEDTISTFKYRIQVNGNVQVLQDRNKAAQIRAILLAGIRGAVLWRQSGGKRWHLLLSKRRLNSALQTLLDR